MSVRASLHVLRLILRSTKHPANPVSHRYVYWLFHGIVTSAIAHSMLRGSIEAPPHHHLLWIIKLTDNRLDGSVEALAPGHSHSHSPLATRHSPLATRHGHSTICHQE